MNTKTSGIGVIITGATGMVGEGVLLECLEHPAIASVLLVNRKQYGAKHPKLKECIVPDFFQLAGAAGELTGYDACFFCAGVSSLGMTEADYTHVTYDLTLNFAKTLVSLNQQMIFTYVSGSHTDGSGKGKTMWARVKGRTENALMECGFQEVYNFRPGFMKPTPGQRSIKGYYRWIAWMYPLLVTLIPNQVLTLRQLGLAMIHSVTKGYSKQILEVPDIKALAEK